MSAKIKNKKAVSKRFKMTASGKISYHHAGLRHNLGDKSRKKKVKLKRLGILDPGCQSRLMACLPNGL